MYIAGCSEFLSSLVLVALFHTGTTDCDECEDMKNNFITAGSPKSKRSYSYNRAICTYEWQHLEPMRPVRIWDFKGTVYKPNTRPACNDGRPTVLLPGYVKLLDGQSVLPKTNLASTCHSRKSKGAKEVRSRQVWHTEAHHSRCQLRFTTLQERRKSISCASDFILVRSRCEC